MDTGLKNHLQELVIINRISEFKKIEKWIADFAEQANLSERDTFALDLVLNEALINIISYGYEDDEEHTILVKVNHSPSEIDIEIIDDALPFNPLSVQSSVSGQTRLEEASIGGRGIILIKKYCEKLSYCYSEQKNHLYLTINKS